MASPIGHTMVGLTAAAAVAKVTGTEPGTALWLGAFVACGLPDLDLTLSFAGRTGPAYHRNWSHSFFVLAAVCAAAWGGTRVAGLPVADGIMAAWCAALLTHPLLDLVTTGPDIAGRGYGLALFWPLSRRRFSVARPIFTNDTGDWENVETAWDLWVRVRHEMARLGPGCVAVLLMLAFI